MLKSTDIRPSAGHGFRRAPVTRAPRAAPASASRSQRRHAAWSGTRDARSAMNRGPCPKTRRWHSSWAATASSASGGASTRRQLNERLPLREQLPHRLVVSRSVIRAGATPSGGPWRAIAVDQGRARTDAEPGLEDTRRRPPIARDPLDEQLVALVGTDPRHPRGAQPRRCRHDPHPMRRPRYGTRRPSSSAGRARAGRATPPAARGGVGSRARAPRGTPRRPARGGATPPPGGRDDTTTPRSGWIVTRRRLERGERRRTYGSVAAREGVAAVSEPRGATRRPGEGDQPGRCLSPRRRRRPGRSPVSPPASTAARPFTKTSPDAGRIARRRLVGSAGRPRSAGSNTTSVAEGAGADDTPIAQPQARAGTEVSLAIAVGRSSSRARARNWPRSRAVDPYVRGCGVPASRIGWPGRLPSASVQTAIQGT